MTAAWTPRTLLLAMAIAAFVAWQVLIPAASLFSERPDRFAWQMYSALPDLPRAWLVDASGTQTEVELRQVFAQNRSEIDYAAALRAGLCDMPGTVAVRLLEPEASVAEVIPCR